MFYKSIFNSDVKKKKMYAEVNTLSNLKKKEKKSKTQNILLFNDINNLVLVGLVIQSVSSVKHIINIICHL